MNKCNTEKKLLNCYASIDRQINNAIDECVIVALAIGTIIMIIGIVF